MKSDTVKPVNVFIVDDDEIFSYATEKLLQLSHFSISVKRFKNGNELLGYLQGLTDVQLFPDYIFLDINMPVMDGWEFLDAYQRIPLPQAAVIKIFLVSSSVSTLDMERAACNALVQRYLIKPLDKEVILEILTD